MLKYLTTLLGKPINARQTHLFINPLKPSGFYMCHQL